MILKPGNAGLTETATRFAVLGSGSAANGFIFEHGDFSFLIDNGYSLPEFKRRMGRLDFSLDKLEFIFLTHSHSDHFKGVEALAAHLDIPVVTHGAMPLEHLCRKPGLRRLDIFPERDYSFGPMRFRCFQSSHDAPHAVGYHFQLGELIFTLITDTGLISDEMADLAAVSDYLFLESNYSPELLHQGSYPEFLKKRILSDRGHLSNLDAAAFMSRLVQRENLRIKKIFLCHLSENNNTVDKVKEEIGRMYDGAIPYGICPRNDCLSQDSLVSGCLSAIPEDVYG